MSVGFGFSVGDFVAGVQLVREVISSLQSSTGSALEYQTLIYELFTLERALLEVKSLRFEDCEAAQLDALKNYQPSLNAQGSGSKVRDSTRKIQWALCKKPDLEAFKAEVRGHAGSINILLATIQMSQARVFQQRTEGRQESVLSALNKNFVSHMRALGDLGSVIKTCAKQGQQLLKSTAAIVHSNIRIYQMVLQVHRFIITLPPQVEREQPIYFIDAFGKESAFFLEWIYSAEVLQDWLERRFKATGLDKIVRKEFALEDTKTRREIDLAQPWDTLFYPGMHVGMDMAFTDMECQYKNSCPACHTASSVNSDEDIICSHCGANVRRITVHNDGTSSEGYASGGDDDSEKSSNARKRKRSSNSYSDVETKVSDDLFQRKRRGQEELCQFRRFRLLSKKQRPLFEQRYLLGRPGQLTTTAKAAATRMRTIKSCWRCILRRIKCNVGHPCDPCE